MSRTFLFVLRGRPGLGHVIPGLALARELVRRGHRAPILTYGNGARFLAASGSNGPGWDDWESLEVAPEYRDWPGLDLYDHGLRDLVPRVRDLGASAVVLGGEYTLAAAAPALPVPTALLLNPEIFEDSPRNRVPGPLFAHLFAPCRLLLPLLPPSAAPRLAVFEELLGAPGGPRLGPSGPFALTATPGQGTGGEAPFEVLLANGGGVDFPDSVESYADGPASPREWLAETREKTRRSVLAALAATEGIPGARVTLFSCLGEAWNRALLDELGDGGAGGEGPEGGRLRVEAPSMAYYEHLERARVVVSRAGAGFLADAGRVTAQVVLWGLEAHGEQALNARQLVASRPGTRFAETAGALEEAVARAVEAAAAAPAGASRALPEGPGEGERSGAAGLAAAVDALVTMASEGPAPEAAGAP